MTAKTTKTTKIAAAKTAKKTAKKTTVRLPAAVQMANRTRMYFGPAYMNAVLGGICVDTAKMVQHAAHLKLGSVAKLSKLVPATLRNKLADAILNHANGAEPFSIKL
jgi:hypothetical protein